MIESLYVQPKSHKLEFLSYSFSIYKNSELFLTNLFYIDSGRSATQVSKKSQKA